MRLFLSALLGCFFLFDFGNVDAFWRMVCGTIQTGRIDPIVSPGGIAGHCHTISGPINLNISSTYASLQAAYCTSCSIQKDKSGYWTPQMYYRHRNGSFQYVPHDGTVVYYLGRGTNRTNIVPFPPGYRVLSGDSGARAFDANTYTFNGQEQIAKRVSFACLDSSGAIPEQPYMFRTDCSSGLRAQIQFPSCWDGVNLYKTDQSHVAYMSEIDNGDCPPDHPYQFIHLFFEVIYAVNNIDKSDGGYFVFSNGDTTGYGFHGDFINGWDVNVLSAAITQCANTNDGSPPDCAPLAPSIDPYYNINCPEQPSQINETVKGLMPLIPGCNPPSGGAIRAPQNICAVKPNLNYVANTDNFVRFIPKPGDLRGNWSYLGCTTDNTTTRPVTGPTYTDNSGMSIESCTQFCHNAGFPIAAMEFSTECFCGTRLLASNPILSPLACSSYSFMVCSGNGLEYCGAQYLMSVWNDTSYSGPPILPIPTYNVTTLSLPSGTVATYQGCHTEAVNARALSGPSITNTTGMTIEVCGTYCLSKSYTLFGTEFGSQCYCGNIITTAFLAEGNCSFACTGNAGEFCGAGSKLSVWSLPSYNAPPAASGTAAGGTPPAATQSAVANVTYLGCYSETTSGPRALAAGYISNNSVSVSFCAAVAQQLNYPLFGLEYATQCLYGDVLNSGSHTIAASTCYMACNGNTQQICGGSNAISLYNNTAFATIKNPNPAIALGGTASFAYQGCYSEPSGARALGSNAQFSSYTSGVISNLTVEYCAQMCVSKGFTWMGVEAGNQCQCNGAGVINGATISAGGDADCSLRCTGNGAEYCGVGAVGTTQAKINIYHRTS